MVKRYLLTLFLRWSHSSIGYTVNRIGALTRNGLSVFGVLSLLFLAASIFKPEFRSKVFFWSPVQSLFQSEVQKIGFLGALNNGADWLSPPVKNSDLVVNVTDIGQGLASKADETIWSAAKTEASLTREQKRISQYLAARYRIGKDAAECLVQSAYMVASSERLDAMLILSVAGIESAFNPIAASDVGAQGLMQVMTDVHSEKFKNLAPTQRSAFHPVGSMQVGARILKDYLDRASGSVDRALRMYVGMANSDAPTAYPDKVKAERERIRQAANGVSIAVIIKQLQAQQAAQAAKNQTQQSLGVDSVDKSAEKTADKSIHITEPSGPPAGVRKVSLVTSNE